MFLLKAFHKTTIVSLLTTYKKAKKESNKKFIFFDIIFCAFKYQASFHDYTEFEFYSLKARERKTFLTYGKNIKIINLFNNKDYSHILDSKLEFNEYFKNYIKRDYLKPNSTKKEFQNFIKDKDRIILKPISGIGGKGIRIIDANINNYNKAKHYLIEEVIIQHPKLSELYDKSVNTIRMFTFFDGKKVHLLQAILKIGNNGIVDNFSSGGMYAFLNKEGIVITPAIDACDNIFGIHPTSKKQILGFTVPNFDQAVNFTLKAALEIPEIKYIGWDIAITEKGPAIIEGNSIPGVFQIKPRFNKKKIGILPEYEKIMKIKL